MSNQNNLKAPHGIVLDTIKGEQFTLNGITVIGDEKRFLIAITDGYAKALYHELGKLFGDGEAEEIKRICESAYNGEIDNKATALDRIYQKLISTN